MKINRVHIDITSECNLSCAYCYLSQRKNIGKKLTTPAVVSIINQASECGISSFSISGGEPLNNPDFATILAAAEKKGNIVLFTNLTVNKKILGRIASNEKVQEIITSLDGFSGHDMARPPSRASEIIEKIAWLKNAAPNKKLTVNTVLHKFNLHELINLCKLVNELGVNLWRLDFPLRSQRNDIFCDFRDAVLKSAEIIKSRYKHAAYRKTEISIFKIYKSRLESAELPDIKNLIDVSAHPCQYFLGTLSIKEDGKVSLCPPLNLALGQMDQKTNFRRSIEKTLRHSFFSMNLNSIVQCHGCRYFQLCGTGCRSDALAWTGKFSNADPISCSIMPLVEKIILPILSKKPKALYEKLINQSGNPPKYAFQSQSGIY